LIREVDGLAAAPSMIKRLLRSLYLVAGNDIIRMMEATPGSLVAWEIRYERIAGIYHTNQTVQKSSTAVAITSPAGVA